MVGGTVHVSGPDVWPDVWLPHGLTDDELTF